MFLFQTLFSTKILEPKLAYLLKLLDWTTSEQHVEQKVTIQSDGDPIDHDEALAQAIQEATAMNPDMTVEKIEIHQTSAAPES